jgi:hypothetical protein
MDEEKGRHLKVRSLLVAVGLPDGSLEREAERYRYRATSFRVLPDDPL